MFTWHERHWEAQEASSPCLYASSKPSLVGWLRQKYCRPEDMPYWENCWRSKYLPGTCSVFEYHWSLAFEGWVKNKMEIYLCTYHWYFWVDKIHTLGCWASRYWQTSYEELLFSDYLLEDFIVTYATSVDPLVILLITMRKRPPRNKKNLLTQR